YEEAVQLDPANVQARLGLARVYRRLNRPDEALAQAEEAAALASAPDEAAGAYLVQGLIYADQNDPVQAEARFARAMEAAPDNGWYALYRGQALFAAGQPDEGLAVFNKALELTDDDARFYRQLGQFLAGRGQWEWVTRIYEQALAEGITDDADIYQGLGDAYKALADHQKALVNYRHAANLNSARTPEPQ
ncbi:MAG: tetratricopeptide repeat protein, partial [Chloroflexi bacterium]